MLDWLLKKDSRCIHLRCCVVFLCRHQPTASLAQFLCCSVHVCSTKFYAILLSCMFNKHRSFTNSTRLMVHIHPLTQEPLSWTYVFFQSLVCFYLWFNILLLVFLSLLIRSECDKKLKICLVSLWHDSAKISAFDFSILFKREKPQFCIV